MRFLRELPLSVEVFETDGQWTKPMASHVSKLLPQPRPWRPRDTIETIKRSVRSSSFYQHIQNHISDEYSKRIRERAAGQPAVNLGLLSALPRSHFSREEQEACPCTTTSTFKVGPRKASSGLELPSCLAGEGREQDEAPESQAFTNAVDRRVHFAVDNPG